MVCGCVCVCVNVILWFEAIPRRVLGFLVAIHFKRYSQVGLPLLCEDGMSL